MKYNYIIFNSVESKIDFNPNGYYAICYNDVRNHNQIQCIDIPLQGYCKFGDTFMLCITLQGLMSVLICHSKNMVSILL